VLLESKSIALFRTAAPEFVSKQQNALALSRLALAADAQTELTGIGIFIRDGEREAAGEGREGRGGEGRGMREASTGEMETE
jgi:hypothetical protein